MSTGKEKKEANRHDMVQIEREIEALSCMTNGSLFSFDRK